MTKQLPKPEGWGPAPVSGIDRTPLGLHRSEFGRLAAVLEQRDRFADVVEERPGRVVVESAACGIRVRVELIDEAWEQGGAGDTAMETAFQRGNQFRQVAEELSRATRTAWTIFRREHR